MLQRLWSLGCILHELTMLQRLDDGDSPSWLCSRGSTLYTHAATAVRSWIYFKWAGYAAEAIQCTCCEGCEVWDVFYMSWLCCRGCTVYMLQRLWSLGCILYELAILQRLYSVHAAKAVKSGMYFTWAGYAGEAELCTCCKDFEVWDVFYMSWFAAEAVQCTCCNRCEVWDVFYTSWLCWRGYALYMMKRLWSLGCILH